VLGAAGCGASPSDPDALDLSGTWTGSVGRRFYNDSIRIELVQSGSVLTGQGVRGMPCPADGTCYSDVTVMGTLSGASVVLSFGPPFGDRFVGRAAGGTLVGTLTGYSDQPAITLARPAD
jgi:hypothetical protein